MWEVIEPIGEQRIDTRENQESAIAYAKTLVEDPTYGAVLKDGHIVVGRMPTGGFTPVNSIGPPYTWVFVREVK